MGMTGGNVRASGSTVVRGTYPLQGVASDGTRDEFTVPQQTSSQEMDPLAFGTGTGYIDRTAVSNRAVPASSSVTWDIYTGTDLRDLIGQTAAFRIVRYVKISVLSGGTASGVRIGGASSNPHALWFADTSDQHLIYPGGPPYEAGSPVGKAVTSSTKNVKVENLGTSEVTLRVVISGSIHASGSANGWLWLWSHP